MRDAQGHIGGGDADFVGDYAPERLLWGAPGHTVHEARAPLSDRCEHVLKRVQSDPLCPELGACAARRLLDSSSVQARCSQADRDAWAHVAGEGTIGNDGAYVITDRLPLGVGELVRLRVRASAVSLGGIVGGVVRGLETLGEVCDGRAHGALTPENVRIAGDDPRTWRGLLTDPAPGDRLEADPEQARLADQRALGRLIALLVTHREPRAGKLAGGDEAWTRLGVTGAGWRGLCETLLGAEEPMELGELRTRVDTLRRRAERPRKQRRIGGVLTLVLAGALGALLIFGTGGDPNKGGSTRAPFEEEPFRAWCVDAEMWVLYLERDSVRRRDELEADPHLAGSLLPVIDESIEREIELDPRTLVRASPRSRLNLVEMVEPDERNKKLGGRTTEALDIIGRLRAALGAWPALTNAQRRAPEYTRQGWRPQGAFLERLSGQVLAPEWADPETGIVNAPASIDETFGPELVESMLQLSEASRLGDEIDAAWTRTVRRTEVIQNATGETPDPILARFGQLPGRYTEFRGLGGDINSVRALHERVTALDALSGSLETFLSEGWERVDRPYFESVSEALASFDPDSPVRLEAFELWLREASDPGVTKLDASSDPRLAYGGSDSFEPIPDEIEALRDRFGAELFAELLGESDLVERSSAALREARSLDEIAWQRLTQDRVEAGAERLGAALDQNRDELASLSQRLETTANAYIDELRAGERVSEAGTDAIDSAWRSMRDDLMARYEEDGRFAELRRAEAPAREQLLEIERRLTLPVEFELAPRGYDAGLLGPVWSERREAACASAIAMLHWNGRSYELADAFETTLSELMRAEVDWIDRIRQLLGDHARIERQLDGALLLDEVVEDESSIRDLALAWREGDELADERVRASLASVLDRVALLESIERENDQDRLVELATDEGLELGAALTAYLGIGEADAAWPGSIDQLETERRAMVGFDARAAGLERDDRREAVLGRVRETARARWTRFADAAGDLGAVDAAAAAREAFDADLSGLAPRAAYNVLLREFQTGVDLGMDEASLRTRVERLRDEMRPLRSGVADSGAQRVIDEIADIARPPDDSRPVLEASMFGPGRHGWNASDIDGGETLVYTSNGAGGPLRMEFVRIEPDSSNGLSRAAYVSRREVSLGAVLSMASEHGSWETLGETWLALGNARETAGEPGGQSWDSARVWKWDPSADRGRGAMVVNDAWLRRHPQMTAEQPAYAPGIGEAGEPLRISAGQGLPSLAMPMNHVSPRASEALAGALSARLPTEQEWRAAASRQGGMGQTNRRDATFARQRDWVRQVEQALTSSGAVSQFFYPDRGAYLPRSVSAPTGAQATALGTDDGVLWLTPVDQGGGTFFNLIGNVAEIVRQGDKFAIIGGSALSAPEVDPMTAYTTRNAYARRGYNDDVGFRLALDVPDGVFRQTVNRRMEKLLARASCVFE